VWAEALGRYDVVRLLNTNLNEEKAADKKLSTVAVRKRVNRKARYRAERCRSAVSPRGVIR
jgi:ferritin-like metal-binding protein YciE